MSAKRTTKKTTAKKAAKKTAKTTAAKAFEAALGLTKVAAKTFDKPSQSDVDSTKTTCQPLSESQNHPHPTMGSVPPTFENPLGEIFEGGDADDYQEYGALGGQDEAEIVERILGPGVMNVSDAQEATQEAQKETSGHIVPEALPAVPQRPARAKAASPATKATPFTNGQAADCVEALIDGLNHLYGLKPKKLLAKDIVILQQRVANGRRLVAQLRA